MSPIELAIRPFKKYADFSGRAPRAEYWWFTLLLFIAFTVFAFVVFATIGVGVDSEADSSPFGALAIVVLVIFFLGIFVPSLAVQVRRMHDQDMSGWWILLFCIPYVGALIALVFMLIPGTTGPNRFGADPYQEESHSV